MSKANSMIRQLERRLSPRRGPVVISMSWGYEDGTMDDGGDRITPEEWRRRHPGERLILMTWGDDDDPAGGDI